MRWNSVRLKLTLWSVSVLAVALLVFAGLLRYQVQRDIVRDTDAGLARFCRFFAARCGRGATGRPS